MTELGPVAWPPAPIRTERLVLRESEARDRAAFIELFASPEVRTYLEACAAALDWFADALHGEPLVLCTQTANDRSMHLAAKLGFTEVERFEEWGAERWFGVWLLVTPFG
ncbi:GNAT family N-acetyltransferase [Streptomyces sp. NPDC127044]